MFKPTRTRKLPQGTETRVHEGERQAKLSVDTKMVWVPLNSKGNAVIVSPYWHAKIDGKVTRLSRDKVSAAALLIKMQTSSERVRAGIQLPEPKGGGKLSELIGQYVANLKQQGCRPSTVGRRPRDLAKMMADLGVRDLKELRRIGAAELSRWASASRLAARTCHRKIQDLRSFFTWLHKSGFVASIPPSIGKRGLAIRPKAELSPEDEKKLMAVAAAKRRTIYKLMLATGCRAGATGSLLVRDLDLTRPSGPVMILRAETSKTKRGLMVPIPMALVKDLKSIIRGMSPDDRAFGISGGSLSRAFRVDLAKAGIARNRPDGTVLCLHALRHTFASRALRSGASPAIVAKVGGWSSLQVLMSVYSHLLPEDGRGLVDSLTGK